MPAERLRGRFIVLEGGEGTGKSTQAALLAERLGARLTREPGGTPLGEAVRSLVLDPTVGAPDVRAEVLLMLAARAQHAAAVIEPALAAGTDVVCDRYEGSTLAYQGFGRGLPVTELDQMSRWASAGLVPDRVILLRVPADVALARRVQRAGGTDRIEAEGAAFLARVVEGFDALAAADPERWRVVDGTGDVAAVAARVAEAAGSEATQPGPGEPQPAVVPADPGDKR